MPSKTRNSLQWDFDQRSAAVLAYQSAVTSVHAVYRRKAKAYRVSRLICDAPSQLQQLLHFGLLRCEGFGRKASLLCRGRLAGRPQSWGPPVSIIAVVVRSSQAAATAMPGSGKLSDRPVRRFPGSDWPSTLSQPLCQIMSPRSAISQSSGRTAQTLRLPRAFVVYAAGDVYGDVERWR